MKAALERFKAEDIPKDAITGSYELNGPGRDREGHHPETAVNQPFPESGSLETPAGA